MNIDGPEGTEYLRVGLTIELSHDSLKDVVAERDAVLRHNIIIYLSGLKTNELQGAENQQIIVENLQKRINDAIGVKDGVKQVILTKFVRSVETIPAMAQPTGRCENPIFRQNMAKMVVDCANACTTQANPIVNLEQRAFEDLFSQPDDGDVATHVSIFGCTRYSSRRRCATNRAFVADPDWFGVGDPLEADFNSPREKETTKKYARVLKDELFAFLDGLHFKPKFLLLLGNASTTGNDGCSTCETGRKMSESNQLLALRRSTSLEALINRYRSANSTFMETEIRAVALNNEYQHLDTPALLDMISNKLPAARTRERGFKPTGRLAVNRSVMVIAINCDLSEELEALRTGLSEKLDVITKLTIRIASGRKSGGLGRLDGSSVTGVFRQKQGAFRHCYEKRLRVVPNLKGKVVLRFTIGTAGRITNIAVTSNSTGDSAVAECIKRKVRGWKFTAPEGGSATFTYPIVLSKG